MNSIYKKNFIFKANRFEEYSNGVCTNKGAINTTIVAKVLDDSTLGIGLLDEVPANLNTRFGLPILAFRMVIYWKIEYNTGVSQTRSVGMIPTSLWYVTFSTI